MMSVILTNMAYKITDSKGKHHSLYENSAMELVNVTSRPISKVFKTKTLKCGRKLTAHPNPQLYSETTNFVFYSPDYKKKLKYPKKAK